MNTKIKIFNTIKNELNQFEKLFDAYINEIEYSDYLMNNKGKMLRPALTIISAKIAGQIQQKTYWSAIGVEMIHNATLVHDDVVDDANERRANSTFRAIHGDKRAVLYGDYLLAKGLDCIIKTEDLKIMSAIARTTEEMSIGEINQMDASGTLSTEEQDYFDIIYKKTASLFICSLLVGYYSSTEERDLEDTIRRIGLNLGLAFQIKDDLLDYDTESKSGKAFGNDIREKKMTLPLIYALQQVDDEKRNAIKNIIQQPDNSKEDIKKVIDFTYQNEGISYTNTILKSYLRNAQDDINTLPNNISKEMLTLLCTYLSDRKK